VHDGPLRTFLALTLEAEATATLAKLGRRVARALECNASGKLRPTQTEQMHLTLAFLGDTPKHLVEPLVALVAEITGRHRSPTLYSDRLLLLPNPRQARVVALGLRDDQGSVAKLAADLTCELRPFGFRFESRPLLPHITLLRSREPLGALAEPLEALAPGEIVLTLYELVHFASFLEPQGARHEVLSTFLLPPSTP
jgi:RNA 2',3'-cyclic 3'-phosphodiesterase